MKLVYCDESGDPGYPKFQTCIFLQSFLYLKTTDWKDCFNDILLARRNIKNEFKLPVRTEFHTREFLLNKNPFNNLELDPVSRIKVLDQFIELIVKLANEKGVKCINSVVIKDRIQKNSSYSVLYQSFKYALTRIDTNIFKNKQKFNNFMIIIDEGYIIKARRISRELFRHNFVPYKDSHDARQIKLESLVDDPLPKNSKDSYFIQLADIIAYLLAQFVYIKLGIQAQASPKRIRIIKDNQILDWVEKLSPIFNLEACPGSEFGHGIVVHPYN